MIFYDFKSGLKQKESIERFCVALGVDSVFKTAVVDVFPILSGSQASKSGLGK